MENFKYFPLKLHDFLRKEMQEILDDWLKLTRLKISASKNLTYKQQRNKIPELLESIAKSAEQVCLNSIRAEFPNSLPKHHARQRCDLGYTLEEVTREYALLRGVIFERLHFHINDISAEEIAFLNSALDESIIEAVINYVGKVNQHLVGERARLEITLKCIGDGVVTTDRDGKIDYMNPAAQSILECSSKAALGQQINNIMITLDESTNERLQCAAQTAIEEDRITHRGPDIVLKSATGKLIPAQETAAVLRSASGEFMGAVTTFRDISKIKVLSDSLGYVSDHDALTRLPNRALFISKLYSTLSNAELHDLKVAVFHIDIDQFKDINDMLGRSDGDLLLRKVAKRLSACLSQKDCICRAESDEFIIFAEVTDKKSVAEIRNKLLENIRRTFKIHSKTINISASIGICTFPADGRDPHTLLMHAETATKQAKAEGRNRGKLFTVLMFQHAEDRRQLQANLKIALVEDQISLHFQPQISLFSGKVVGAEALLRWNHPIMGDISPGRFIPVAERNGELMVAVGDWVITKACHQMRSWIDSGYAPIRMSVNVSVIQLRHDSFVDRINELLDLYQIHPDQLQLEITESLLMSQITDAAGRISALKLLGLVISVDDFGTGYSSLSYLQEFPVDELKIDKSFLRDIIGNHEKKSIVKAIISLGKSLNIRILAEGVEDFLTADYLKQNGCKYVQGFFYSKAIPAERFEAQYLNQG